MAATSTPEPKPAPQRLNRSWLLLIVTCLLLGDWFLVNPYSKARCAEYLEESIVLAASTYATCRVVNAGVSVIQESSISATPLGIGLELHAGQILDPINDATERLSGLAVSALGILGAQRLLLEVSNRYFSYLLLGLGLVLIARFALSAQFPRRLWLVQCFLFVLVLKISLLALCYMGITSNDRYFNPSIAQQLAILQPTQAMLEKNAQPTPGLEGLLRAPQAQSDDGAWYDPSSYFKPFFDWLSSTMQSIARAYRQTSDTLAYFYEHSSEVIEAFSALFVLLIEKIIIQVFVLPLCVLWLLRTLHRQIFGTQFHQALQQLVGKVFQPIPTNGQPPAAGQQAP